MSSTSGQWFRKRIDSYSEELSKSFTEAKARVQRGLEQLKLKNAETFKRIPSLRGSFRAGKNKEIKKTKSPRKKKSQPNSPQLPSERSRTSSTANSSELNATYRISRKAFNRTVVEQMSCISSSESEHERETARAERTLLSSMRNKRPALNSSHSFPRVNRSRKIENINIVFDTPFPSPVRQPASPARTSTPKRINDLGVVHRDAFDMNNLYNVMAQIRARQGSANPVRKPPRCVRRCRKEASCLAKSPASSLEQHTSAEEESCSDSELAMSTDISLKSYDSGDDDEPRISPPLPIVRADSELDDDVYWISKKVVNLPRTSSRLSMQSRSSYGGGGVSPGLSPIKNSERRPATEQESQMKRAWGMTYKVKKVDKTVAKKLFSIDEAHVADSGYSDRSGATSRATSSRATLYELQNNRWRVTPSPTTSASPSPTPPVDIPAKSANQIAYTGFSDGPYVLRSFYV